MSKDRPLIAVIDDEEPVRKALGRLLQSAGMAVETFSGGGEFLAALGTHRPDCAVLDLHMPEMTGFDVLERIAETGARVPVVVITGHDSPDAEECAMRGGACGLSPQTGQSTSSDWPPSPPPWPMPDKRRMVQASTKKAARSMRCRCITYSSRRSTITLRPQAPKTG